VTPSIASPLQNKLLKERRKRREEKRRWEEDVSNYWSTLRKREDTVV
jgi:hypothetical protein